MVALLTGLNACKKKDVTPGLSAKIQQIVPKATLDDMKSKGLIINEGNTPPNIEGIFQTNPHTLLAQYGPEDNFSVGRQIPDYRYRLTQQKGDDVLLEEKQVNGNSNATGTTSFLAGSGNKFTLFGELTGTTSGIPNTTLTVISGEITSTGIKDFQYAFVLTKKTGDASNATLIPINKSRVWVDGNALASKISVFRLPATDGPEATPDRATMAGNR